MLKGKGLGRLRSKMAVAFLQNELLVKNNVGVFPVRKQQMSTLVLTEFGKQCILEERQNTNP